MSALVQAIRRRNADEVRRLAAKGLALGEIDGSGMTPLMHAARASSAEVAKVLIEAGAAVDQGDVGRRYTPLHFAVQRGDVEMVRVLLDAGANPDAKDVFGNTALMLAALRRSSPGLVAHLMAAGSDPDVKNNSGVSPSSLLGSGGEPVASAGRRRLIFEHPTGQFASARDALVQAFEELENTNPDTSVSFVAQGQGGSGSGAEVVEVEFKEGTLGAEIEHGQLVALARYCGVSEGSVALHGGRIDVSKLDSAHKACVLDWLFRVHLGVKMFQGEDDYAVGVEQNA